MHICRGGGSGWAGRCEIQTGLLIPGGDNRSDDGDRASEETSAAVRRGLNHQHSLHRGHSFIHSADVRVGPAMSGAVCLCPNKIVDLMPEV